MISALDLARLCEEIYSSPAASWDHYWDKDNVVAAHRKVEDSDVIIFRGSKDALDWIRDAEGWPTWHNQLGFCHAGFLDEMDDVFAEIRPVIGSRVIITGHSLGGARARILTALCAYNKIPVERLCTFGSPKPAFANLSRLIQKSGMMHETYRNRNDPVPLLPGILPWWTHHEDWVALNSPAASDDLTPLRDHHIGLYVAGLAVL